MSKRCPECRQMNDDSRIFCAYCGAALEAHLRLIQDLEKQKERSQEQTSARQRGDVNFYTSHKQAEKKKSSPAPWIILGLVLAAAVLWFFLH